ncbi:TPA: hypothetical protein ACGPAP_002109, partial [Streptococcus suis]
QNRHRNFLFPNSSQIRSQQQHISVLLLSFPSPFYFHFSQIPHFVEIALNHSFLFLQNAYFDKIDSCFFHSILTK